MGGVYHKIRRLRNVVLGKIALLQRHPPGGKIGISLPLPRLQAAGLLFFCVGQEHPQRFVTGQQRVVAVAALQNHQRLRGQLPRGQVRSLGSQDTIAPAVSKGNTTLLDWINDEIKSLGEESFFHKDYEETLVDTYGLDYEDELVVEGGETNA